MPFVTCLRRDRAQRQQSVRLLFESLTNKVFPSFAKFKDAIKVKLMCGGFTQDGHHNVILQDLNRAAAQEVQSGEHVAAVDQSVSRRSVSGSEAHCQGPEAAFGGSLESFAVVKKIPVEVKADVCLQALRKTLQHLGCTKKKKMSESLRKMYTDECPRTSDTCMSFF